MTARARLNRSGHEPPRVLLAKAGIECTIELVRCVTTICKQHEVLHARSNLTRHDTTAWTANTHLCFNQDECTSKQHYIIIHMNPFTCQTVSHENWFSIKAAVIVTIDVQCNWMMFYVQIGLSNVTKIFYPYIAYFSSRNNVHKDRTHFCHKMMSASKLHYFYIIDNLSLMTAVGEEQCHGRDKKRAKNTLKVLFVVFLFLKWLTDSRIVSQRHLVVLIGPLFSKKVWCGDMRARSMKPQVLRNDTCFMSDSKIPEKPLDLSPAIQEDWWGRGSSSKGFRETGS